MQRFITCRFLDVANTMLEITDFCPKLRFFSILITDFNFQRLAALVIFSSDQVCLRPALFLCYPVTYIHVHVNVSFIE